MRIAGSANNSEYFYIVGDNSHANPGEPITGLLFSDIETGGSASYMRQGAARVDLTLITLANASVAHSDGGFILVDDTNMPGVYRCDFPDAAYVAGVSDLTLYLAVAAANNALVVPLKHDLLDFDYSVVTQPVNITQLGGVVQSLTDLKDFADSGYDPVTNKVQGVVLVDTLTTLTGHTVQTGDSFARLATYRLGELMSAALASQPFSASLMGDLTQDDPDTVGTQQFTVSSLMRLLDEVNTGVTHNINNSVGKQIRQLKDADILASGTAQAGAAGTITLQAGSNATDNYYRHLLCVITGGTGAGQSRTFTSGVGATLVYSLATGDDWTVTPDNTSTYDLIRAGSAHVTDISAAALTSITNDIDTNSTQLTSILGRIGSFTGSGINTILGFFQTALKSDASNPSDLGGTYDAATDSQEALSAKTAIPTKNTIFSNMSVFMVDSTDNVTPKTGLTLSVTRSLDGGAFGSGTGTAAEISSGMYQYDASAADMNADVIIFRFTGTAAADTFITVYTKP